MRRLLTLLVMLFVFGAGSALGQTKQVTGVVTSADDKQPIPGVNVFVKEAPTIGAVTDASGRFLLKNVPANAKVIVFRFVGFTTLELPIKPELNVALQSESQKIDEVMVVAYGTAKKGAFSGSAIEVKGAKLERKKTSEFTQALAGEVAGVQVITTSGQPGMSSTIRIRGIGSLNASQEPLIVVDGIPFGGDLSSIDPRDIASSTILKDASAAALYGSRAANGVLLIQTKKGSAGKSKITASVDFGVNTQILPYYKTVNDPAQYYQYSWEALKNAYVIGGYTEAAAKTRATSRLLLNLGGYNLYDINGDGKIDSQDNAIVGTDGLVNPNAKRLINDSWRDELIKPGLKKTVGINMSGGHEKTTYYTSLNYLEDEGYVAKSDFKRLSTTTNLDHKVQDWLKFSEKLTYSYFKMNNSVSEGTTAGNNAFFFANNMPPIYPVYVYDEFGKPVYDADGERVYDYADNNALLRGKKRKFAQAVNPARSYDLDENYTERHEVGGNLGLEANILPNLKFTSNFGFNYSFNSQVSQQNGLYGDQKGVGSIQRTLDSYMTWTWNQLINWNKSFNRNTFSILLGHEAYKYTRENISGYKTNVMKEHSPFFSNAVVMGALTGDKFERSMESYFGEVNYDYSNKYFFKASLRSDASSRFPNDKWGTFWSLAGSWKLSEEEFIKQHSFINNLKYKVSYGVQGNENISSSYPGYETFDIVNVINDYLGVIFNSKGNPNLTWESNYNFNTGVELGLWNRVNASFDFYIRDTRDMLYERTMASSVGYSAMYVNDLDMRNTGFEFDVNVVAFKNKNTEISFAVNGHTYKNKITKMPVNPLTGNENLFLRSGTFGYEKGRSVYDRYIQKYAGVDPTTGSPTWWSASGVKDGNRISLVDLNKEVEQSYSDIQWEKTGDYTRATRTFVGNSAIPDLSGGFSVFASHKGFEFDVKFLYSIGGKAYDGVYARMMNTGAALGTQVYHEDIAGRWQKPGDITDIPKLSSENDKNIGSNQDRWLIDASYLTLSNIRLGYTFGERVCKSIKLNNLNLYVSGTNLFSKSKRVGYYPQTSETGTTSGYRYMPLSAFTFGVNLSF